MLEYKNRIESLLSKISNNLAEPASMQELEKRFYKDPIFKHTLPQCRFCDPAEVRIRQESVLFAALLTQEKLKNISEVLQNLEDRAHHISTDHEIDNLFHQHVIACLKKIIDDQGLQKQILRLTIPILNSWTEYIIRSTLRLSKKEKMTNVHIQTLFLSALFHPLRQNVGSCFATAPAIIIQKEQLSQFFKDLEDLLNVGILKRTFVGHEHAVPISTSWGPGILNKTVEMRYEDRLWQSSELIHCLEGLQILDKKSRLNEKESALKKILFDRLKLKEGQRISLNELIKKILLHHYKLDDKDIEQSVQITSLKVSEIYHNEHSLSQPFGKYQKFQESLDQARLSLINFHENPLLKTWEYTFASFGETQSQFFKWNLYTSLGFDSKKPFSIAGCIYSYIDERLKFYNEKIKHHDQEYEQEFFRVKMLEKRVVNTESEQMAGWARAEYQNHLHEMNFHHRARDEYIDKNERLSQLLPKIIKTYDQLFPQYFQEVYDASMQEVTGAVFEDSPAGFRLLYKHGRQDPSLWTFIKSKEDFIAHLKDFFVNTEFEVSAQKELEEFKDEYSEIVTQIIHLIQTDNFIYAAFQRICDRYHMRFPSHDLSKLDTWSHKPWSYVSGGTTERLMQHYYKREAGFTQLSKKVVSETELFAFIIDAARELTQNQVKHYESGVERSMLMLAPTHAFLLKPEWLPLNKIWEKDLYSFTWIRDVFFNPQVNFLQSIQLSPLEIHYFINTYFSKHPYFILWIKDNLHWPSYSISLVEFRASLSNALQKAPYNVAPYGVNLEVLDGWIYECFPLTSSSDLYSKCSTCIEGLNLDPKDFEKAHWVTDQVIDAPKMGMFIRSCDFFEIVKRIVSIVFESVTFNIDWSLKILNVLRDERLAMPAPFKFADTNWPHFNFSFTVNPATLKLELWRMNSLGNKGFPMHQWKKWFAEEKASDWIIFTKPEEYLSEK